MNEIFNKITEKFSLKAFVSDDKIRLFLEVTPPEEEEDESLDQNEDLEDEKPKKKKVSAADKKSPKKKKAQQKQLPKVTRKDIVDVLLEFLKDTEAVNLGVIDDIAEYITRGETPKRRRIIKGREPVGGADGRLLYLVKRFSGEVEIQIDQKGFANFAEMHLFDNVKTGQTIARIYPPKPGIDGEDVFGEVIPAPEGNELEVRLDHTATKHQSPNKEHNFEIIKAECDGYVSDQDGAIAVKTNLEVRGDIDYHCGNIEFIGTVTVRGDVLGGFKVEAREGIEINGAVRGGSLICPEGDIKVSGMVLGGEGGKIICGGTFTAAGVQDAKIEADGDIFLSKEAHCSELRTKGAVIMPRGYVVSGEVYAARGIEAKAIGNDVGTSTAVHLCSDIQTSKEYSVLVTNLSALDKVTKLLEGNLGPYAAQPESIEALEEPMKTKMKGFQLKLTRVTKTKEKLQIDRERMFEESNVEDFMFVSFHKKLHSGVEIFGCEDEFPMLEDLEGPASLVYSSKEQEFAIKEFTPLSASE